MTNLETIITDQCYTTGTSATLTAEDDVVIYQSLYNASTGDMLQWKKLKPYMEIKSNWATTTSSNYSVKIINQYVKKISTAWENDWCRTYLQTWGDTDATCWSSTPAKPLSVSDRLRQMMQDRQGPMILVTRNPLQAAADERERRARETLCRVVGEEKFRNFLRCGFVSVRAKSG
jgi:hypothetical protein